MIHTARCRARYAKFIRGSFDPNAVVERDEGEVQDLGEQGFEGLEGYVELPEDVRDDVGEEPGGLSELHYSRLSTRLESSKE